MSFASPVALACVLALSVVSTAARADEVVVFAAASLKTALDPIAAAFQADTGNTVTISYAGSNALAKQIVQGAPADMFISASEEWMDEVEKNGDLIPDTRSDLLGNRLVVVAHDAAPEVIELSKDSKLAEMLGSEKLAMGMVDAVPAGQYGKQALEHLGLWDSVKDSVAQTDNVRAALALVSAGEAKMGIVYATDAAADKAVHIVADIPETAHDAIVYPVALTKTATDPADRQFLDALKGDAADKIFKEQGFTIRD